MVTGTAAFAAAVSLALLAGVSSDSRAQSGGTITPKPGPVGVETPCPEGANKTCLITITVTPDGSGNCSGAAVSVSPAYPKLGDTNTHKRVEFRFATPGYVFCPRSGDGVFFDATTVAEDLFDLVSNKKCERFFEWKRKKADGNSYAYLLRFRNDANTRSCVMDPWVRNG